MAEECAECGASFGSPAELILHQRKGHTHSGPEARNTLNPNEETPYLECALCGAKFRTREELAAHDLKPHGPGTASAPPRGQRGRPVT
jgi:uncharacterized C2H2 Zn-finger protein